MERSARTGWVLGAVAVAIVVLVTIALRFGSTEPANEPKLAPDVVRQAPTREATPPPEVAASTMSDDALEALSARVEESPAAPVAATSGVRIHGFVMDEANLAVAGAEVEARLFVDRGATLAAASTTADEGGGYELVLDSVELTSAPWESLALVVVASAPERGRGRTRREPGTQLAGRVDVVIFAPFEMTGVVVDEDTAPVRHAECWLVSMPFDGMLVEGESVFTDEEGAYRLPVAEPDWYCVVARHSGYGVGASERVLLLGGRQYEAPPIMLLPFASLTGRVTRDDGEPAAHVSVGVVPWSLRESPATDLVEAALPGALDIVHASTEVRPVTGGVVRTDAEGLFAVRGLQDGLYLVLLGDGQWFRPVASRELFGPFMTGTFAELTFDAPLLVVEVLGSERQPMPRTRIELEDPSGAIAEYLSGADGRVVVAASPGTWTARWNGKAGESREARVRVRPDRGLAVVRLYIDPRGRVRRARR